MSAKEQTGILLIADSLTICLTWAAYYLFRVRSGWLTLAIEPDFVVPMIAVYLFWVLLFFLVGLYRPWYAKSRLDEITLLFKTTVVGCLFLFFAIFIDDQATATQTNSRLLIVVYWAILFGFVVTGRLVIRSIQRRMLIAGVGVHRTIIVGSEMKSRELYDEIEQYPALGYRVVGFVSIDGQKFEPYKSIPVLDSHRNLNTLLSKNEIQDVLIALDSSDHQHLLEIIVSCNSYNVGLKIIPDLYDIISGQARTNQIYGFPLIEISPQLMTPWEESTKRAMDVAFSAFVLIVGLPVWALVALCIKSESKGPALYKQERVGRDGRLFKIYKFRSMRLDAEAAGPQWANKSDPRVTRVGYWLRKLHLDEIPQLWNILKGDMSVVGPRPERPVFVDQLSKEIPLYPRRLKVRPGLTGWAQVKHKYDESIEDVRKKVQYDLFYIENMSLRMDIKIILSTISHTLLGRGHT
ncbi:MAG: sugar transferase [Ignavibacteriae bacterium]|nr:sugar transferase [Ignavibacteriota bacterium]